VCSVLSGRGLCVGLSSLEQSTAVNSTSLWSLHTALYPKYHTMRSTYFFGQSPG
jgi:hypothetical protein